MALATKIGGLLLAVFVCYQIQTTYCQFGGMDIHAILGQMNRTQKIMFLATMLNGKPELYDQLENAIFAALPILNYDIPPGILLNAMLPWALDHLPNLLENKDFLKGMEIFITEINDQHRHNSSRLIAHGPNATTREIRDMFVSRLFKELDYATMIGDFLAYEFPYNSTTRPLSEQCYNSTVAFVDQLMHGKDWALRMFDAAGKPTTGIMKGVMYFVGTYDECVAIKANIPVNTTFAGGHKLDSEMSFGGRYCRATITPPRSLLESVAGDHINNTFGVDLRLSLGICLPDTCTKGDIEGLLNLGLLGSLLNMSLTDAVCDEEMDFEGDSNAHIVTGILGSLVVLAMISSLVDLIFIRSSVKPKKKSAVYSMADLAAVANVNNAYDNVLNELGTPGKTGTEENGEKKPAENGHVQKNGQWKGIGLNDLNATIDSDLTADVMLEDEDDEGTWKKLLRSFSVFTNMEAVIKTDTKPDDIACLYGVRFFSMAWIVLGNTYIYTALSLVDVPVAVNMMDSFDILKRFTFQAVLGATFATDTFFMISGCLISYWYLARTEKGSLSVVSWLKFYAGKYWKMTPPYMLVMATYVYLYMYLSSGPMWPNSLEVADRCRDSWWKNLFYINNLFDEEGVTADRQCMTWSWQLAVTMQFYLISPILLSFLSFSSSMGLLLILILAGAGMISAGVREAEYGGDIMSSREDGGAYWDNVFIKPWCRVSSYCVGMLLGFVLQKMDHKKPHKLIALLGWILAACVGVLIVYCQYTKYADGLEDWTLHQLAAFEALGRPGWAACVAWVVYACCMGFGGPIQDFLSWRGFVPLSRVSYMVYLIHPILMVFVVYSRRSLIYMDDFDMAYLFIGHLTVNYVAAFFAMLLFDMPFRNLKRIVSRKSMNTAY